MRRRFQWDKKYLYWGLTAFCVVAASILFFLLLTGSVLNAGYACACTNACLAAKGIASASAEKGRPVHAALSAFTAPVAAFTAPVAAFAVPAALAALTALAAFVILAALIRVGRGLGISDDPDGIRIC